MQTIFPILRYRDARAAIRWLCETLGFEVIFCTPESGDYVRNAQLRLGDDVVMLGSVRPEEGNDVPMHAFSVYVEDVDAHFERVRSAGADITRPIGDTGFGARLYSLRDLEGNSWTFGNYRPRLE